MNDEQKSVVSDNIQYNDYVRLINFLKKIKEDLNLRSVNLGELLDFEFEIALVGVYEGEEIEYTIIGTPLEMAILAGHLKMIEKMIEIKTPVTKSAVQYLIISTHFSNEEKIKLLDKFLASGAVFSVEKNIVNFLNNSCDPEFINYFIGHKIMAKKYLKRNCKIKYEKYLKQKYATLGALKALGVTKRDARGRFLNRKKYSLKKPVLPNELARKIIGYLPEEQFVRRFSKRR